MKNKEQPELVGRHARNKGKPKISRITSLRGFGGVILGRDMAEVFKDGHVYNVSKILGEITVTDLGEHAVDNWLQNEGILTGTINQYATSGTVMLTKEEYKQQKKLQDE